VSPAPRRRNHRSRHVDIIRISSALTKSRFNPRAIDRSFDSSSEQSCAGCCEQDRCCLFRFRLFHADFVAGDWRRIRPPSHLNHSRSRCRGPACSRARAAASNRREWKRTRDAECVYHANLCRGAAALNPRPPERGGSGGREGAGG